MTNFSFKILKDGKVIDLILVLHFDLNGTAMWGDSTDSHGIKEAIMEILTRVVYGTVKKNSLGNDEWVSNDMCLEEHGTSFYNFAKERYPKNYKEMTQQFLDTDERKQLFGVMYENMMKRTNKILFKSFENAIDYYYDATFALRTFGNDGKLVEKELGEEFMWFQSKRDNEKTCMERTDNKEIFTMESFNKFLYESCDIVLVKEDYEYWTKHGRTAEHGKLLYGIMEEEEEIKADLLEEDIDEEETEIVHIMFDDNYCVNVEGKNAYFFHINPYLAMCNDNYYLDLIAKCLQDHCKKNNMKIVEDENEFASSSHELHNHVLTVTDNAKKMLCMFFVGVLILLVYTMIASSFGKI
jgi:hypothetical protein